MQVKGTSFNDRQENSAKAKLELLKRAREKSPMNDPNFAQRMAEKAAAAAVREKERAERKTAKEAEKARLEAERIENERIAAEEAAIAAAAAQAEAERLAARQAIEEAKAKLAQFKKR
ncbi:MAG: DUF6481 family protein [Micropepsaceae bacterium]